MSKRKLKRQLSLAQIVMLGTAGCIGGEIFVLTGHVAGITGPATVLVFLLGGLLSYSIALNYCELATTYPETGGAMTYVKEAFGNGILSYLVGSMDCLSSTFYAALSAVGFAYSLQVFFPALPIVLTAVIVIVVFTSLNLLGVGSVGNAQVILGIGLLGILVVYVVAGFTSPHGFRWATFVPDGTLLVHGNLGANLARIMQGIALAYVAYVGFEVIADDAEEAQNPSKVIPRGILISLTLVMLINMAVVFVTLGTVPWQELAGSETALTDAVRRFLPTWGVSLLAIGGIVATLTSINSAMLSATREAFTLGRNGVWPRQFAKLSGLRTPWVAIVSVGAVSALIAVIGLVDFLSYISSAGYLFVLFFASLAMVRLRSLYPDLERPFRVPFFPLTAYLAAATCVLIVVFTELRALGFGVAVLVVLGVAYYAAPRISRWVKGKAKTSEPEDNLILVSASNPATVRSLVHLGSIIAQASEDAYICVMSVATSNQRGVMGRGPRPPALPRPREHTLWSQIAADAVDRNVGLYTKLRTAVNVSEGILEEIAAHRNIKLLVMGWPGPLDGRPLADNPVKVVLQKARTNVAVVLDRGLGEPKRILVPVGGGPHSRMALRLANEIAISDGATVTALRLITAPTTGDDEEVEEDQKALLADIVEEALGGVPTSFNLEVRHAATVPKGILEASQSGYELVVIGSSEEWSLDTSLLGTVDDWIAERVPCSVVFCRRYEPVAIAWLRYRVKRMGDAYDHE